MENTQELINSIQWEVVDTFFDKECSIYQLEGTDKEGNKYQGGCYCNSVSHQSEVYPDESLDIVRVD